MYFIVMLTVFICAVSCNHNDSMGWLSIKWKILSTSAKTNCQLHNEYHIQMIFSFNSFSIPLWTYIPDKIVDLPELHSRLFFALKFCWYLVSVYFYHKIWLLGTSAYEISEECCFQISIVCYVYVLNKWVYN